MELIGLLILLVLSLAISVGVGFMAYWPIYGAPYVPTKEKDIAEIFKNMKLMKGQVFCDIGCGDGRMVMAAGKITQTKAWGIDINWGLVQWCKAQAYLGKNKLVEFKKLNVFKNDFPKADVYYVYFWPGLVEKIADRIQELNIKTEIVSKGFEIKHLKSVRNFEVGKSRFWIYEVSPTTPV